MKQYQPKFGMDSILYDIAAATGFQLLPTPAGFTNGIGFIDLNGRLTDGQIMAIRQRLGAALVGVIGCRVFVQ